MPDRPGPPAGSFGRQGFAVETTWAGVLVVGALLGAGCLLTDQLQSALTPLGQLVSPWVLVAAWAGSRARGWPQATSLGAAALVAANAVYFVGVVVAAGSPGRAVLWTVVALFVGPVAGIAGMAVLRGPQRGRAPVLGLLATVSVAEAAVLWQHVRTERTAAVVVALIVTVACSVLARATAAERRWGAVLPVLLMVAVLALPASLVLESLLGAVGVITA